MKKYKIIGGEKLSERTFTAQHLMDEDGNYVAHLDEVITAIEEVKRLRGEVVVLRNVIENIRWIVKGWIVKEKE
jgi:hypothetical protein